MIQAQPKAALFFLRYHFNFGLGEDFSPATASNFSADLVLVEIDASFPSHSVDAFGLEGLNGFSREL